MSLAMKRRALLILLAGGLLAAPSGVRAQPGRKVYRIGLLFSVTPATFPDRWPFYERMRELGWVYGRDFVADSREYGESYAQVPDLANELIRVGVDLFVVQGDLEAARVQEVTRTIPIVTTRSEDPVTLGLAASLARPGGNVTGIQAPQLVTKHLSLLKDAIPRLARAGLLLHGSPGPAVRDAVADAELLGIALQVVPVQGVGDFEAAFSALHADGVQGVVVVRDAFMGTHAKGMATLAVRHGLATVSDIPHFAAQGNLMTYSYNVSDIERSAADIVDKILRGTKPGEVPVQPATTFRLVINLTAAKALGLAIPPSLLLRADEVIT